jgi:hypothetical protein
MWRQRYSQNELSCLNSRLSIVKYVVDFLFMSSLSGSFVAYLAGKGYNVLTIYFAGFGKVH